MATEQDQAFLQILREEKNITNFLDAFFGFLYRCTDFYVESGPDQKLGFPPGIAEKLIISSYHKWNNVSKLPPKVSSLTPSQETNINNNTIYPSSSQTRKDDADETRMNEETQIEKNREKCAEDGAAKKQSDDCTKHDKSSDSYNGAVRENYTWSQSISDLDVLIKLPHGIKTAKDLKVALDSQNIKVEARVSAIGENNETRNSEWTTIFDGELSFKTKKDESVWSIVPGKHISIHLEKAAERWWEALIVGEPKIELNQIDCSRNLEDMGSAEQMKVQELMWNHQQKLLGKPTSEEIKMEKILKMAWDAKGSPFEGTPYDPSILKFN